MDKFPSVEVLSRYSPHLLPTCCQHRRGCTLKKETPHETCRPAVPDHSGAPAYPETTDSRCDRSRVRDLEADDLPRYRDPDGTARADPRGGRHGLHSGEGIF